MLTFKTLKVPSGQILDWPESATIEYALVRSSSDMFYIFYYSFEYFILVLRRLVGQCRKTILFNLTKNHRLNMEGDLQSLFGLHVT